MNEAPTWHLHRDFSDGRGVLGRLEGGGGLVVHTLENASTLIPLGTHQCARDFYHTGGYETFEVGVDGRDRILFHAANYPHELRGCIAPGRTRQETPEVAVWNSRDAFEEFMARNAAVDEFTLIITSELETNDA